MSWRWSGLLAVVALGTLLCGLASADLRCDNRLVQLGASKYDVTSVCGPPDATEHRIEQRSIARDVIGSCPPGVLCRRGIVDTIEVSVDEWVYDFGTHRFLRYLTFEDGKLVKVRSGGYGHKL